MYRIFRTEVFIREFGKIIPKNLVRDIESRILKIAENPYIGKPLGHHLWELKADKFRVYYTICDDELIVLFIGVSDKKHQQDRIDALKNIPLYEAIEKYKKLRDIL